jgi:hypothetical protein
MMSSLVICQRWSSVSVVQPVRIPFPKLFLQEKAVEAAKQKDTYGYPYMYFRQYWYSICMQGTRQGGHRQPGNKS